MIRRLGFFIISVAFCTGCAGARNHPPTVGNESQKVIVSPSFNWQTLEANGVAMLPVVSDMAPEGIRNNAAFEVSQALNKNLPNVKILPVSDTMEILRQNRMDKEFKNWLAVYEADGPINPALLHRIGRITGKRYLLLIEVNQYKDEWAPVDAVHPSLPLTGPITSPALTRPVSTDVSKDIAMKGRLWDSECRTVVWEGKGRAWVMDETPGERVRMEDLFLTSIRNFISSFLSSGGTAKGSGPGC
jgi:hypothetical protein